MRQNLAVLQTSWIKFGPYLGREAPWTSRVVSILAALLHFHLLLPPTFLVVEQHLGHLLHQLNSICSLLGGDAVALVALALGTHLPAGRIVAPVLAGEEHLLAEAGALASADAERLPRAELPVSPHPLPELTLVLCQLLLRPLTRTVS